MRTVVIVLVVFFLVGGLLAIAAVMVGNARYHHRQHMSERWLLEQRKLAHRENGDHR